MTDKQPKPRKQIIPALLVAAAMLGAAWIMRASGHKDDMFMLILMMGYVTLLIGTERSRACERSLFRRLFRRGE